VPYTNFFLGSTTVAGALTGLLFVAVSIAPGRMIGPEASAELRSVAATAFSALLDALWLSLLALWPGNHIPRASLVLGLLGVGTTAALMVRLARARPAERLSRRWPVLLSFLLVLYGAQAVTAFTAAGSGPARSAGATLVLIFFGVGIARSWELLGLRGGGLSAELAGRARQAVSGDRG
jgi:hypothetical protein